MGWTFVASGESSLNRKVFAGFPPECELHIVILPGSNVLGIEREVKYDEEVGRVTITTGAAKLEAVGQSLEILPGQANSEQSTARYQLQPRDSTRSEIFLIRTGDTIYGSKQTGGLLCKWDASEVQVNSSAASDLAVSNVDDNELGVTETPEEETADEDEDLDKTVDAVVTTQTKTSQRPQATPKLSAQQSLVVEETPTIARINDLAADSYSTELDLQESHFTNVTPLDNPEQINVEQYSTARTGESQQASEVLAVYNVSEDIPEQANAHKKGIGVTETPSRARVVIPLKRQSLIPLNVDSNPEEAEQRPAKRRKGAAAARNGDDTPSSHSSQLIMEAKAEATPSRRRGRQKPIDAREGAGTPQSQRSTSVQADTYDGPVPYVALSNSSIAASGHTVKFLKKQGGSLVDSVKGDFNMLCVRDGSLHKTAKVLRAIAIGAPIVTDKWLIDSAVADQFLSVQDYRPSVSEQESEWNFSLKDISGTPQRPFEGRTIHFTSKLQAQYAAFAEIEQVCLAAGASRVTKRKPSKDSIVLGAEDGDEEVAKFMEDGSTCYGRDLIPMSIFRGALDLDSEEFRIKDAASKSKKSKKGRKS